MSVNNWREHFITQAKNRPPFCPVFRVEEKQPEDMVTIVSPVAQSTAMARAKVKRERIKRKRTQSKGKKRGRPKLKKNVKKTIRKVKKKSIRSRK